MHEEYRMLRVTVFNAEFVQQAQRSDALRDVFIQETSLCDKENEFPSWR